LPVLGGHMLWENPTPRALTNIKHWRGWGKKSLLSCDTQWQCLWCNQSGKHPEKINLAIFGYIQNNEHSFKKGSLEVRKQHVYFT
jgi:hypothetical protein